MSYALIKASASHDRIEADVRTTEEKARARGGAIAEAAKTRLEAALVVIDEANAVLKGARAAESASWSVVEARDAEADVAIGSVRDAMWNALGRTQGHPAMTHVFPGGIGTYTSGSPLGQPVLMQVLQSRIRSAEAPAWTDAQRDAWTNEIEATRAPLYEAVEAYRPLSAALTVAEAARRSAIRSAHSKLVAFKRDLKNLGLTEAQIHDIIPDDERRSSGSSSGGRQGGDPAAS